jgi:sugar phosphate permease
MLSRRWAIFTITCLIFILSQFYRASVAVIAPDLMADLNLDTNGLSLISAAFFYAFAIMQIPVALYLDRIGPRLTMTVLSIIGAGGVLIFALGDSLYMLVIGRVLLGAGMACNLMGTLKLITTWFGPSRFATLSALVISFGTLGSITATTPLVLMVEGMGWRATFIAFAIVNFLVATVLFTVVRDAPSATFEESDSKTTHQAHDTWQAIKQLFGQKDYWIISLGTFSRYGVFAAVQALWAGPYLMTALKIAPVTAGNLLLLMSIGMILGSPAWGYISDALLYSRKIPIYFGLMGKAVILVFLANLSPGVSVVLLSILFFSFGFVSSSGQIMFAHIKERMPIESAGTAMTGINFFTMAGVAFFLQVLGNIMQQFYPGESLSPAAFKGAYYFCAAFLVVTTAFYLLTVETLKSPSLRK